LLEAITYAEKTVRIDPWPFSESEPVAPAIDSEAEAETSEDARVAASSDE
jgi:hypothetical protein